MQFFNLFQLKRDVLFLLAVGVLLLTAVVLIGPGRSGLRMNELLKAVAIAALFNDMKCFPEKPDREFDYHFAILALVSLAGVDGQYLPGGEPVTLKDVDYLVLQGSHDMDISTFMGYNQYDRVQYSGLSEHFKAAVYIYGASHGQFNSGWGRQTQNSVLDTNQLPSFLFLMVKDPFEEFFE
ncbi:MAG: hypothetical protein QM296_12690 [Bacillota bacterium]|nr:hypothetical protein [Bacillota bacterium]